MELSKKEIILEEKRLEDTTDIIRSKISELGQELYDRDDKVLEFKKFMWDNRTDMDPTELKTMMSDNDLEISMMMNKGEYLQKLFKVQNNPYFGSIIFNDGKNKDEVYIGITHVIDNKNKYYVHDWRSPICSLFYDYEVGPCSYMAPMGKINGNIDRKRQYTIKDAKLLHIFDNNINIDDELLQEVLANESNDKMKNIVNTIQMEQNKVIRNTDDKTLIVQGIAGSGKTSVALHRIAFLLYKIENLKSNNVLIFSPNKVFSEYISNVLPELGEDNTMQTTINDFLDMEIKEFKKVESFTSFIERSYTIRGDFEFIKYKQSDMIYDDIDKYIDSICKNVKFMDDLFTRDYSYTKDELNYMLNNRYGKFPLCERIKFMAIKLSEVNFKGRLHKAKTIEKELYERLNMDRDLIKIYINFFSSEFSKINKDISYIKDNKNIIHYDDACLYVYMKCKLFGYNYNTYIKQIVIDEAQDYSMGQLKLINKIFKNASYTILGDVNQTINPYYKYNSLEDLTKIFDSSKYIELTKTYRSSEEIIEFSNKVLGLNHVTAIRRNTNIPVIEREEDNLYEQLISDINECRKYGKSIAIVTKNDSECDRIYKLFKDTDISKIDNQSKKFNRKFVVVPVYMAKGLEFDSVIIYTDKDNKYMESEKYLYYVAITRAQHKLIVYNQ
ncbi:MAG: UvrD-helicase domain-containing protein [Bacilli bacterium]|nr:UvrD-helicase domain-containing protein [Bacilli bacterium]